MPGKGEVYKMDRADLIKQIESYCPYNEQEETDRQIICLNVVGGFKSHEIGEMMQMNHNTVRSRISRGLNKMKEFLA